MILFHIDESGTGLKDPQSPYFVLAAIGIPASEWQTADDQITALKRHLVSWAKPDDFEIKGRDIRRGEKFFKNQRWEERVDAFRRVGRLLLNLPCHVLAVQVDTRDLPEYVATDNELYRLAFWRLLDAIEQTLESQAEQGMLLVDARSDLHSSIQDRRLVDAYRDWAAARSTAPRIVGIPWFGFSAFYAGLQLADFVAYLIDMAANDLHRSERNQPLYAIYAELAPMIKLLRIP